MFSPLHKSEGDSSLSPMRRTLRFDTGRSGGLYAVDVTPAATVVRRGKIGEFLCDAIRGHVETVSRNGPIAGSVGRSCTGRAAEKVDTIARQSGDIVSSPNHTNGDVRNVVIGTAAVGKPCRIPREPAKALLVLRL